MKIEGRNAVEQLLLTDLTIDKILIENGLRDEQSKKLIEKIKDKRVKIQYADKNVLYKESETGKFQGFIAFTSEFRYCETIDILNVAKQKGENPFIVICDGVEDVHNLGSIIRVCECAGVHGLIIGKHRSAVVNETVMRVSEGACNHMKIVRATNINSEIDFLKENNVWVMAAEIGGESLYKTKLNGSMAFVIGGEDSGVKRLTKEKCDGVITIPMKGKVNSLNASIACSVVVFEKVRQELGV